MISLPHDSKILGRNLIEKTVGVSAIPLRNGNYDRCIIQEWDRRREVHIICMYIKMTWHNYQYHYF